MPTDYTECRTCHVRTLLARSVPALNFWPDPAGKVAVTISDPRTGRFLARGEEPGPLEHRFAVHECAEVAALPLGGA